MSRLIDADALKQELKENYTFYGFTELLYDFYVAIDAQPTIDAVEVVRGEWIETNNGYDTTCECSACHYRDFIPNYQVGSEFVCQDRYWFERDFCPICGAKMKGADDEF